MDLNPIPSLPGTEQKIRHEWYSINEMRHKIKLWLPIKTKSMRSSKDMETLGTICGQGTKEYRRKFRNVFYSFKKMRSKRYDKITKNKIR